MCTHADNVQGSHSNEKASKKSCHGKWAKKIGMEIDKYSENQYRLTAVIWIWAVFNSCSRFQIIILDRPQTIFSSPYFQFKKRFDFYIILCYEYARRSPICLPVNCHGKVMEFYYQIYE